MNNTKLTDELLELKKDIEENKEETIRLKTKLESAMESLAEEGCKTLEEAKEKLTELEKEIKEKQKEIETCVESLEKEYSL